MMNSWDAAQVAVKAGHPGVIISYRASAGRLSAYGSRWEVIDVQRRTDPAAIHNGGNKFFYGTRNSEALQEAMEWATKRYGVTAWAKVPGFGGDYFPAEAAPVIKAARKQQA